ncbi:peroxiredoxin family protein [Maribacter sp. 2304DJ31-5]|uniref:peroxiredoxin family protein n=1 Tax=Maribacter sp. 2304DJ31-5 TaxID=3386273 RepID=UPI0039BD3C16
MKKHIVLIPTILILVLVSCKNSTKEKVAKENNTQYTITGSGWEAFEGDEFRITIADTVPGNSRQLFAPIIKNGSFTVKGNIAHPQYGYFGIYDQKGEWKYYKGDFIFEAGKINIVYDTLIKSNVVAQNTHRIDGGHYNQIILNQVRNNPIRLKKLRTFRAFADKQNKETYKDTAIVNHFFKLQNDYKDYNLALFEDIRHNHKDPYARLLAMSQGHINVDPSFELKELEKEIGAFTPEMTNILFNYNSRVLRSKNSKTVGIGKVIKDFTAKNLSGDDFHLANVLKKNKYTLIEFWASWCSPCRAEIPHMKKAYERFNDKGFEIVSFSLDHKKDRWIKASEEEDFPWVNIGDLLAMKSPVAKMYGVRSIPDNYLVNSEGIIIAEDLRKEKLDKKLEELFKN